MLISGEVRTVIIVSDFWNELDALTRMQTQNFTGIIYCSDPFTVHESTSDSFFLALYTPLFQLILGLVGWLFQWRSTPNPNFIFIVITIILTLSLGRKSVGRDINFIKGLIQYSW